MLFKELRTAFPSYDNIKQQTRHRKPCGAFCNYKLITPFDALLPFQYRRDKSPEAPIKWEIKYSNGSTAMDISNNIPLLEGITLEGMDRVIYRGQQLIFNRVEGPEPLQMPSGVFLYWQLSYPNGPAQYSELFYVPADRFSVLNPAPEGYVKLEWGNSCDIRPIYYASGFKNVMYLDTNIVSGEAQYIMEGEEDKNGTVVPSFQSMADNYRFGIYGPSYVEKALIAMQMCDYIHVTDKGGVRAGPLEQVDVVPTPDEYGCNSSVQVTFWGDELVVKEACCDNMVPDPCPVGDVEITSIEQRAGGVIALFGEAPLGTQVSVLGSSTQDGVFTQLVTGRPYTQLATGLELSSAQAAGNLWFKISARTFNCTYDDSAPYTSVPPPVGRRILVRSTVLGAGNYPLIYSINGGPSQTLQLGSSTVTQINASDGDSIDVNFSIGFRTNAVLEKVDGYLAVEGNGGVSPIDTAKKILNGLGTYIGQPDYDGSNSTIVQTLTMDKDYELVVVGTQFETVSATVINDLIGQANAGVNFIISQDVPQGSNASFGVPKDAGLELKLTLPDQSPNFARVKVLRQPGAVQMFDGRADSNPFFIPIDTTVVAGGIDVQLYREVVNNMRISAILSSVAPPNNYYIMQFIFDSATTAPVQIQFLSHDTNTSSSLTSTRTSPLITIPAGTTTFNWNSSAYFKTPGASFGVINDITLITVNGFDRERISKTGPGSWVLLE